MKVTKKRALHNGREHACFFFLWRVSSCLFCKSLWVGGCGCFRDYDILWCSASNNHGQRAVRLQKNQDKRKIFYQHLTTNLARPTQMERGTGRRRHDRLVIAARLRRAPNEFSKRGLTACECADVA